jgi:hypothetical protein
VLDSFFKHGLSNHQFIIRQWRAMAGFEDMIKEVLSSIQNPGMVSLVKVITAIDAFSLPQELLLNLSMELLSTKDGAPLVPALLAKYHATSDKIKGSVFLHIAHELFPDNTTPQRLTCIAFPLARPENHLRVLQKGQDCRQ